MFKQFKQLLHTSKRKYKSKQKFHSYHLIMSTIHAYIHKNIEKKGITNSSSKHREREREKERLRERERERGRERERELLDCCTELRFNNIFISLKRDILFVIKKSFKEKNKINILYRRDGSNKFTKQNRLLRQTTAS